MYQRDRSAVGRFGKKKIFVCSSSAGLKSGKRNRHLCVKGAARCSPPPLPPERHQDSFENNRRRARSLGTRRESGAKKGGSARPRAAAGGGGEEEGKQEGKGRKKEKRSPASLLSSPHPSTPSDPPHPTPPPAASTHAHTSPTLRTRSSASRVPGCASFVICAGQSGNASKKSGFFFLVFFSFSLFLFKVLGLSPRTFFPPVSGFHLPHTGAVGKFLSLWLFKE